MRGAGHAARAGALLVVIGLTAAATPASAQVGARAKITSGPSGEVTETTATFTFERTNDTPFTEFHCRIDGGTWKACTSPVTYSGLTAGRHVFDVRLAGLLADMRPDVRRWVVAQRQELLPCQDSAQCPNPLGPSVTPPAAGPLPPQPPRRRSTRRDARGCAYGANRLGEVSLARLETATLCLINAERRAHGRSRLRRHTTLTLVARRHTRDMVRGRYFAHVSRSGVSAVDRIRRSGYLRGARYWAVGEIIAWRVTPAPTPERAVRAWMNSPPHRRLLLKPGFREVGTGVAAGSPPYGTRRGATFAAEFGFRD